MSLLLILKHAIDRVKSPGFLIILFGFLLFLIDLNLIVTEVDYIYHYIFVILLPIVGLVFLLSNTKMFVKAIGVIRRDLIAVELVGSKKDIKYTLAKYTKDGKLTANLFYVIGICKLELYEDGTIEKKYTSITVNWWLPLNKSKRIEHILINDIPDIETLK